MFGRQSGPKTGGNGYTSQFVQIADAGSAGRRQIVLVPGAAVPMLTLDLPEKLRGLAREQVARRQLQDRLGLPPEQVEMRPFTGTADKTWQHVLVADTDLLQTWRAAVSRNRNVMLPDYFGLPTTEGLWTVLVSPENVAVRFGPDKGFGSQSDLALVTVKEWFASVDERPKALLMLGEPWAELSDWAEENDIPVTHAVAEVPKIPGLGAPAVLAHGETTCNLSRDPALVRDRLRSQLTPWRWPVVLLLVAVGLWIASDVLEIQRLRAERISIQNATEDLVRDVFVPEGPILDVRSQVQQAEDALRRAATGESDAIDALALFESIAPVVFDARARTRRVSSPDGLRLDLVVETADFAAADGLSETLAKADGLEVRVVESRRTGDGAAVRTELQLRSLSEDTQP